MPQGGGRRRGLGPLALRGPGVARAPAALWRAPPPGAAGGAKWTRGCPRRARRKGSKAHLAVGTLGPELALLVRPAGGQDRAQVAALAEQVQQATGEAVEVAFVAQGDTGEQAAEAKRGFVLLPRRWVVARSNAWPARFRRLARADERLPDLLAGLHFLAFAIVLRTRLVAPLGDSAHQVLARRSATGTHRQAPARGRMPRRVRRSPCPRR